MSKAKVPPPFSERACLVPIFLARVFSEGPPTKVLVVVDFVRIWVHNLLGIWAGASRRLATALQYGQTHLAGAAMKEKYRMRKALAAGFVILALFVSSGCGDIVPRGVEVITEPPGATVKLGKEKIGESPVLIPWKKIKDHYADTFTVEILKEGYRPHHLVAAQYGGTIRVVLQKK